MRTFHIGGTAAQVLRYLQIKAKFEGTVRYDRNSLRQLEDGNNIVLNKNGSVTILGEDRSRNSNSTTSSSAPSSPLRMAARSRRATPSSSGIRTACRFSPRKRKVKIPRHIEGVTMKRSSTTNPAGNHGRQSNTKKICTRKSSSSMTTANRWPITQFLPALISSLPKTTKSSPARSWQRTPRKTSKTKEHHRRSAACCRALRSSSAQGRLRNLQNRRHVDFRSERSRQALHRHQDQHTQVKRNISSPSASTSSFQGRYVRKGQQLGLRAD